MSDFTTKLKQKLNEYQLKPVLTADGRQWAQRCYVCDRQVNYIKDASVSYVRVGDLVRHKKCFPGVPL